MVSRASVAAPGPPAGQARRAVVSVRPRLPLLAMAAALAFAGCLGTPPTPEVHAPLVIAGACPPTPAGLFCNLSPSGDLDFHGVLSSPQGGVGLLFFGISHNVTLHDLVLDGFTVAIEAPMVASCDCTLALRNVTLLGNGAGGSVGLSVGLLAASDGGNRLTAALSVTGSRVLGFSQGINTTVLDVIEVHGLRIDCHGGGAVLSARVVEVSQADVAGCRERALDVQGVQHLRLSDSRFVGNGIGTHVRYDGVGDTQVARTNFSANGIGLMLGYNSANANLHPASIEASQFLGNGAPSEWLRAQGYPIAGLVTDINRYTVKDSAFVGNVPLGIYGSLAAYAIGATWEVQDNWWGDARGPTLAAESTPAPTQGLFGDAIPAYADYMPYKTAP